MKSACFCLGLALALNGCDQNSGSGNSTSASASDSKNTTNESAATSAPAARRFTKGDFVKSVLGKTKAQVRAQLGSPDSVSGNEWLYFHLPVYDADAGTQVGTTEVVFGGGYSFALDLYHRDCVDQDQEDCAKDVSFD